MFSNSPWYLMHMSFNAISWIIRVFRLVPMIYVRANARMTSLLTTYCFFIGRINRFHVIYYWTDARQLGIHLLDRYLATTESICYVEKFREFVAIPRLCIYTRLQKRWHLESINCYCKRKSSEYALGILFFPAMYFLLQRIRIVNYWLSWWKWGYCLNTTHKSVGSHRSRFILSRCQRFCNRVYICILWKMSFDLFSSSFLLHDVRK